MKSLGKTYIIDIPEVKEEVLDGGIILPAENKNKVAHYKGTVIEIGLGFHNDNQLNIGDVVLFDWKDKSGKVKVIFSDKLYYIVEEDKILAKEIE